MKKIISILLCLCSLFTFAACNDTSNNEHTDHTFEWEINEQTHFKNYTCGCSSPDIAELHIYDNDNICDVCGYEKKLELTYEYDEISHWMFPSDELDKEEHTFNENGVCLICGFDTFANYHLTVIDEGNWLIYDRDDDYEMFDIIKFHTYVHPIPIYMYVDGELYSSGKQVSINENNDYIEYRYEMPNRAITVEFKTDLVQYSWFSFFYPWLGRSYRDFTKIEIEQGKIGVSPEVQPTITTITYSSDISKIKDALFDMIVCQVKADSKLAQPVEGGSYIQYTFYTKNESFTMRIDNKRIELDGKIYLIYGDYPVEIN